jgi:5-methylcytosine-specific restriction endonuclease McrA
MKRGQFNKEFPNHFDFGASLRKAPGVSSFNRLVRQYKANARRRGRPFELTDDEVRTLTSAACVYCGKPPAQRMESKDANGAYIYNGIDRVSPTEGYVTSNCVSCCKRCNAAKGTMTHAEWQQFIAAIVTHYLEGGSASDNRRRAA